MCAKLLSFFSLSSHVIEVEVEGPGSSSDNKFKVSTIRNNPAPVGVVTGKQTYASFLSSIISKIVEILCIQIMQFVV